MRTSRQGSGVEESAAQRMPMLVNLGVAGDPVRGREQRQGFVWRGTPLFSDAAAHPAPSLEALTVA